jgi:hypothetical protein
MVKRLRFRENRRDRRHRDRVPRGRWVFEPLDLVLAFIAVAALLWLQWLAATLAG